MSRDNALTAMEDWVEPLLRHLTPAARRTLARDIAKDLRRSQVRRIARQENPDGSPFTPRKPTNRRRRGAIRRRAMFAKIRQVKYLKIFASENTAEVAFIGRVADIARIHHYGLRDKVSPDGPEHQYPERQLLGFTEDDLDRVRDTIFAHLDQ